MFQNIPSLGQSSKMAICSFFHQLAQRLNPRLCQGVLRVDEFCFAGESRRDGRT